MGTPRNLWLVLNGKASADECVRRAVADARTRGHRIDVRVTWETGDARRHVQEAAAAGAQTVVAAGGDGTLGAVANALLALDADGNRVPTLGILALGTANDFASAAGIPLPPDEALALVLDRAAMPVDMLRIEAAGRVQWALNLASGGFGTAVTTETNEGLKKMLGGLAYVLTGLSKLGRIDPLHVRLQGPGFEHAGDFIALGIGNGRQAGGGQVLCPGAQVDDGLLDVTVVPPLDGEVLATIGTLIGEGRAAALDQVALRRQLPWVRISTPVPLTLNLDGEPVDADQFRIDCVPARLRLHLPPDSPLLARAGEGASDGSEVRAQSFSR
ncbi:MAG: lipid kinase YegS [Pseudoxanthomonas suwonensis]|nr:lipid kinase YegS [Pseudoxanthomonas suwonensis]